MTIHIRTWPIHVNGHDRNLYRSVVSDWVDVHWSITPLWASYTTNVYIPLSICLYEILFFHNSHNNNNDSPYGMARYTRTSLLWMIVEKTGCCLIILYMLNTGVSRDITFRHVHTLFNLFSSDKFSLLMAIIAQSFIVIDISQYIYSLYYSFFTNTGI